MTNDQQLHQQHAILFESAERYAPYNELIGAELSSELQAIVRTFKADAENALETNRLLRIGIVGQIKRGKSTFLNALFFGGEDILPKAITPMTASLTAIKYSSKPRAVVEYFSEDDWVTVAGKAKEFNRLKEEDEYADIPEDVEASHELFEKAKGIENLDQYFGKSHELENFENLSDLVGKLDEFVGAAGILSPLVKKTEIFVNIPALVDIEVVDTPGLNDPILSRAMITKEYMGKCDVIFLLSSCSQFLPMDDMRLLRQNIPSKGIKDIVLIGSRFDNALLESSSDYKRIDDQIEDLREMFTEEAERNINRVKDDVEASASMVATLQKAMPPIFISAMCHNLAKHFDNLSDSEAFILSRLNSMYDGIDINQEKLIEIANLSLVEEKMAQFRKNKETILNQRFQELLKANKSALNAQLLSIKKEAVRGYERLSTEDITTIEKKQKAGLSNLQRGKNRVDGVFENHIISAEKQFSELKAELKAEALRARRLKSYDASETKSYHVSTSKWYNPFTWGTTKVVTDVISYKYANIHEALEKLEDFVLDSEEQIRIGIREIINIPKFRGDIIRNIRDMFDVEDENFNPEDIMLPVENAANRIVIPDIKLDVMKHISTVRNKFEGKELRNDNIDDLRIAQAAAVEIITDDIYTELSRNMKDISNKLVEIKESFIPQLTNNMQATVDRLRKQLEDKKRYMREYEALLLLLENDLSD